MVLNNMLLFITMCAASADSNLDNEPGIVSSDPPSSDDDVDVQYANGSMPLDLVELTRAEQDEFLSMHNKYRCMHGAEPLTWHSGMASSAASWGRSCCKSTLVHSKSYKETPSSGENLAAGYGTVAQAVKGWYDEVKDCKSNSWPGCEQTSGVVGHFTAMVWKSSTLLGCARDPKGWKGRPVYVCRYAAAAPNMQGRYKANVLPATKSEAQCAGGDGGGGTPSPRRRTTTANPRRRRAPSLRRRRAPSPPSPAACTGDKQTKTNCDSYKASGYCKPPHKHAAYMKRNCCATCEASGTPSLRRRRAAPRRRTTTANPRRRRAAPRRRAPTPPAQGGSWKVLYDNHYCTNSQGIKMGSMSVDKCKAKVRQNSECSNQMFANGQKSCTCVKKGGGACRKKKSGAGNSVYEFTGAACKNTQETWACEKWADEGQCAKDSVWHDQMMETCCKTCTDRGALLQEPPQDDALRSVGQHNTHGTKFSDKVTVEISPDGQAADMDID